VTGKNVKTNRPPDCVSRSKTLTNFSGTRSLPLADEPK
jgi:hypothetical protein